MKLLFLTLLLFCSCSSDSETDVEVLGPTGELPQELSNDISLQNDKGEEKSIAELEREFANRNRAFQRTSNEAVLASRYANQRNEVKPNYIMGTTPRIQVDPKEIVKIKKLAMKGDRDAQYSLGLCYKYALGVKQDRDAAAHWLEKAAEQGHFRAKRVYQHLMRSK